MVNNFPLRYALNYEYYHTNPILASNTTEKEAIFIKAAPTRKKALIRFPQPSGSEGYIDESVGKPNIDELSKVKSLRHVQVIRGLSKYAIELDDGDALEVYYDTREDFIKINGTNATLTEDQQQVSSKRRYSVANFAIDLQ